MKALDLTIHPRLEDTNLSPEDIRQGRWTEIRMRNRKRLTDTELAAEYWRLRLKVCASGNRDMKNVGHVCTEWKAAHDELDTIQRFMELPHYDEVTA